MHYAVALSRANQGLTSPLVRVEVHLSNGLPAFTVVGMPETAVRESKDRVRSAILNSHFEFPDRRITVNLAPADLPKGGGGFDLPIALGILAASGQIPGATLSDTECLAELALDGALRPVRGAVAATIAATGDNRRIALAAENAPQAAAVTASRLLSAPDLLTLCAILCGRVEPASIDQPPVDCTTSVPDMADVQGQQVAKRVLEIAAAGAHNLLLFGPPGAGKSMLAACLPGILPPPTEAERLTALALHDLQGVRTATGVRPFRTPHHSASSAALVGGGSVPQPGEISLAHGGVLFLDELPEFSRHTLDMLREPLETGEITLARARCSLRYPAKFQLVAAMNPCPCGFAGDAQRSCRCAPAQRIAYASRVSGPLLDRIDLRIAVGTSSSEDLFSRTRGEPSSDVARRVARCHQRQLSRQGCTNAALAGPKLTGDALQKTAEQLLRTAVERLGLSARAVHRCLRVARTIADLDGRDVIESTDVSEALGYRELPAQATP